jgi:hypothetical protein
MNLKLVSIHLQWFDIEIVCQSFQIWSMQCVCKHVAVFVMRSDLVQRKCVWRVSRRGGVTCYIQTKTSVLQNALFFRVLSYVRHVEKIFRQPFIQERQICTHCVPIKNI